MSGISFTHDAAVQRIVFGPGTVVEVPRECDRLGLRRVLVIGGDATLALADLVAEALGTAAVARFTDVLQHVPAEQAERVVELAREEAIDGAVTMGGGSTTGLGKVVALRLGLPIIAVPTSYAGSEMTPIYGITSARHKETGRDLRVIPRTVIYDPELTVSMPPAFTASSGMNALAHAVEALWLRSTTPIAAAYAEKAIGLLAAGLREAVSRPDNVDARSQALMGACLAGRALGLAGVGLHHKICHVLGGRFALGHSEVHSVVLPHVVAFNAGAAPAAMGELRWALKTEDPAEAIFDLAHALGAPISLADVGLPDPPLEEIATLILAERIDNPRTVQPEGLVALLAAAHAGRRPKANDGSLADPQA